MTTGHLCLLAVVLTLLCPRVACLAEEKGQGKTIETDHHRGITCLSFSPDGKLLATAGFDRVIRIWDMQSRKLLQTLEEPDGLGIALCFSPDGQSLLSGGGRKCQGDIIVWDTIKWKARHRWKAHGDVVSSLAVSPDGKMLASGSFNAEVTVWNYPKLDKKFTVMYAASADSLAFNKSSTLLASGGGYTAVLVWDCKEGKKLESLQSGGRSCCIMFSPTADQQLAIGTIPLNDDDGKVLQGNLGKKEQLTECGNHAGSVSSLAYFLDGTIIASGGATRDGKQGEINFWDSAKRTRARSIQVHRGSVECLACSPDGAWFAAGSIDGLLTIWPIDKLRNPD
jgi:WD40 repeat protein